MSKILREGKRLRIRYADEGDLDFIMATEADDENARLIIADSREEHKRTLDSPEGAHFIVERADTEERVGFFMVMGLDSPHHAQEWRRVIINDRGKGYGKEALSLLEEWAFEDAGAHRVWLDCMDHNTRALHVYERAGFRREGLCRDEVFSGGRYHNLVILALLDWEWRMIKGR